MVFLLLSLLLSIIGKRVSALKKEFISVVSISYELLLIVFSCVYLNTDLYFSVTSPTRSDPNSHLT